MRRRLAVLLFVGSASLAARTTSAVEIQTFFDEQCVPRSGILLRVDDTWLRFIGLDGTPQALPREAVSAIVTHRTLENPLARITLLGENRLLMRDVWLGRDRQPSFTGWTVGFFENLVVFLDIDGTTHVLDREDIGRIRPLRRPVPGEVRPRVFAPADLGIPDGLVTCPTTELRGGLRPTRVIGDRIKVGEHLAKLAELFREVDGFEERTRVYARPFLFDRTMRLGLSYFRKGGNALPLYFQWSSGRPYRFQSLTALGRIQNPSLPTTAPSFSVRSDLKSHFFHAYFAGHIPSLAAGSQAFQAADLVQGPAGAVAVDELYNYMMMMGADFGGWSASVGSIYRDFRVRFSPQESHELTAERASLVFRVGFTGRDYALRALYFRTRQTGGEGLHFLARAWDVPGAGSAPNPFDYASRAEVGYRLAVDTFRLGATYEPLPQLRIGADEVVTRGSHRERNDYGGMDLSYWQAFTSVFVSQAFGQYVSATGFFTLRRHDYQSAALPSSSYFDYDLGGALEFLF
jgi:hypothetical protein